MQMSGLLINMAIKDYMEIVLKYFYALCLISRAKANHRFTSLRYFLSNGRRMQCATPQIFHEGSVFIQLLKGVFFL